MLIKLMSYILQGNQVFFGMDVGCGQGNTYESRKVLQAKKYN